MGVLLMDELSNSFCGRLFDIIVRATGVQSAHGLFLRRGCFRKTDAKAPTLSLSWPGIMLRVLMV